MRGKCLLTTCVCMFLLAACSFSDDKKILNTKDLNYSMPKTEDLKKSDNSEFVKNSIPIDCVMVPSKLTNNNILIGTEKRIIKSYDIKSEKKKYYTL